MNTTQNEHGSNEHSANEHNAKRTLTLNEQDFNKSWLFSKKSSNSAKRGIRDLI